MSQFDYRMFVDGLEVKLRCSRRTIEKIYAMLRDDTKVRIEDFVTGECFYQSHEVVADGNQ